jgi:hypothetical protein
VQRFRGCLPKMSAISSKSGGVCPRSLRESSTRGARRRGCGHSWLTSRACNPDLHSTSATYAWHSCIRLREQQRVHCGRCALLVLPCAQTALFKLPCCSTLKKYAPNVYSVCRLGAIHYELLFDNLFNETLPEVIMV